MPIVTAQDIIEQSDFSLGLALGGEDPTTVDTALLDDLNLVLDENTGSLVTRGGFSLDWTFSSIATLDDHFVLQVFPFQAPGGSKLVVVVSDGSASADNVGLILLDLDDDSYVRMDTAGRTWTNPLEHHWGVGMEGVWYGGVRGEEMYSYTVTGAVWSADASVDPGWKTLVDDVNDNVDAPATEYARDFAFKGKERVLYDGAVYTPSRSIRYDKWADDENTYQVGDRVSRWATWNATIAYSKSFKCILKHNPATVGATSYPGTGATWKTYWTKVRLPLPSNTDDGTETNPSWYFVPTAAATSIACWHANRLFMRYDDEGDRSRLLFSAPIKPDKGEDVPDVTWNPTDFAPGDDKKGSGGGWLPFNDGTHHGFITALNSYGDRLLVFKRQAVWALVGVDDTTWQEKRVIERIGCVGPDSHVGYNGLVYFLSDEGLYVTDGQEARPAPGNERVRDYIRDRLDVSQAVVATGVRRVDQYPVLWYFDGFIWISMPSDESASGEKSVTLAYHPESGSFYKTDLPVRDVAVYRWEARTELAFAGSPFYGQLDNGAGADPKVFSYDKATTSDSDGNITPGSQDIAWRVRFGWWSFSTLRAQRRIRRVWTLVKAVAQTVSIVARKDYSDTVVKTTTRTSTATSEHLEGEVFADSHAVNFQVSGTKAPASVYGIAVHTQPRHVRYHN